MCPIHHQVIDADEATYTVQILQEYKNLHEAKFAQGGQVANDDAIDALLGVKKLGIRSFDRGAENISSITDVHLDLLPHFDGRNLRKSLDWHEHIFPPLQSFLKEQTAEERPYHLHLPAHACIGFAAGYCLDSKTGVNVVPVQYTTGGRIIWEPDIAVATTHPLWSISDSSTESGESDIALALSVTREIGQHVREHVVASLPAVHRIIECNILPEPSPRALRDGTHALHSAEEIMSLVQTSRSAQERKGTLHLFASAPIGFLFFLGQMSRGFGKCVLYEHDFEGDGSYKPSLIFPR
jgi:hypothetical protein